MKEVYLNGKRIRLDPTRMVGEGGEAEVYDISRDAPGRALKLWKPASHPDYKGSDEQAKRNRDGATARLREQQHKIREFPSNLPAHVVRPQEIVTDKSGKRILGYTMQLLSGLDALRAYAQITFRKNGGASNNDVIQIFRDLHQSVSELHGSGIVVGDFNNLNVLVKGHDAYLIDADSMQFGRYPCRTFTARFVDPLICDPKLTHLVQNAPHSERSDWYAFMLMLFESLLLVHPYGGIYQPNGNGTKVKRDERPLKRISVLHPQVIYPAKGLPLDHLPDDLLHYFSEVLEKDLRGEFPRGLLEQLRWTRCTNCGTEHARALCPNCAQRVPQDVIKEVVRGNATLAEIFRCKGNILRAAYQNGRLRYLYHENGEFKREDGRVVMSGTPQSAMRYRLRGSQTVIAMHGQMITFDSVKEPDRQSVDTLRGLTPLFDSNADHNYWISNGRIKRDDKFGSKDLGEVLSGQTWFRVGPAFGFGFYRAGSLQVAFVFNAETGALNDSIKIPPISGNLLDAACYFTEDRCWFFVTTEEHGRTINRCHLIASDGRLIDSAESEEGDEGWLGSISGKSAATFKGSSGRAHCLFAATAHGLVRLQEVNGRIAETAQFPDTQGMLQPEDSLFYTKQGLYVVTRHSVKLLRMR